MILLKVILYSLLLLQVKFPYRDFSHWYLLCTRPQSLQSCLTLCDPVDRSPPGSSVRGILQAKILELVAMPSSRGSSQPMSLVSCIGERVLYHQRHLGSLIFADTEVNDWVSLLLLLLLSRFSRVRLCATPQRAAHQAALSLGLSRQEYRSGLPFPSPTHACMHAKLLQSSPTLCQCTGFSRQEYWSELPFPSPAHACMLSCFSHLQLYASPQDSPGKNTGVGAISFSTPWWFSGKESACNGDLGSIPGLGRSPAEGIEMATQSNILAWEIPWTEEPGGLQSMGSQKSQT